MVGSDLCSTFFATCLAALIYVVSASTPFAGQLLVRHRRTVIDSGKEKQRVSSIMLYFLLF